MKLTTTHYPLIFNGLIVVQLLYTYSGRENLIRTASKQKALTHTAVIKPQVCLLFTCKQINKIKIC